MEKLSKATRQTQAEKSVSEDCWYVQKPSHSLSRIVVR